MSTKNTPYQVERAEGASRSAADGAIEWFRGEFAFLSNFFEHPVEVEGIVYPTTEHAFQAMKTYETSERYQVRESPTPAAAKARGRKVHLREDWDTARFAVMEQVLRVKFQDPELRRRLLSTGNRELIEGNTWRDTTWGAVRGADGAWRGRNELGKLLMQIRDELRGDSERRTGGAKEVSDAAENELIAAALAARENAYAPYSKYKVGAAIRTADGHIFGGCNVENASYGLSNCAERTAVFSAVAAGAKEIAAVAVVTEDGGTPCGACRQVLSEFAPRDGAPLLVFLADATGVIVRKTTLAELFPDAFRL